MNRALTSVASQFVTRLSAVGTSVIEAQRLGAHTLGVDVDRQ